MNCRGGGKLCPSRYSVVQTDTRLTFLLVGECETLIGSLT